MQTQKGSHTFLCVEPFDIDFCCLTIYNEIIQLLKRGGFSFE